MMATSAAPGVICIKTRTCTGRPGQRPGCLLDGTRLGTCPSAKDGARTRASATTSACAPISAYEWTLVSNSGLLGTTTNLAVPQVQVKFWVEVRQGKPIQSAAGRQIPAEVTPHRDQSTQGTGYTQLLCEIMSWRLGSSAAPFRSPDTTRARAARLCDISVICARSARWAAAGASLSSCSIASAGGCGAPLL